MLRDAAEIVRDGDNLVIRLEGGDEFTFEDFVLSLEVDTPTSLALACDTPKTAIASIDDLLEIVVPATGPGAALGGVRDDIVRARADRFVAGATAGRQRPSLLQNCRMD